MVTFLAISLSIQSTNVFARIGLAVAVVFIVSLSVIIINYCEHLKAIRKSKAEINKDLILLNGGVLVPAIEGNPGIPFKKTLSHTESITIKEGKAE